MAWGESSAYRRDLGSETLCSECREKRGQSPTEESGRRPVKRERTKQGLGEAAW